MDTVKLQIGLDDSTVMTTVASKIIERIIQEFTLAPRVGVPLISCRIQSPHAVCMIDTYTIDN